MPDWNRSHKWIVHRCIYRRSRLLIRFADASPTLPELMAVRRALAEFRNVAPATLRSQIVEAGLLRTSPMRPNEAESALWFVENEKLTVSVEDMTFTELVPYNRTEDDDLVLDDKAQQHAIAESMIASGIRVKDLVFDTGEPHMGFPQ